MDQTPAPPPLARTNAEDFATDGSHIRALADGATRADVAAQLDRKYQLADAQLTVAARLHAETVSGYARKHYLDGAASPEAYVAEIERRVRQRPNIQARERDLPPGAFASLVAETVQAETARGLEAYRNGTRNLGAEPAHVVEGRTAVLAARATKAVELAVAEAMIEAEITVTPARVRQAVALLGGAEAARKMDRASIWTEVIHADVTGRLGSL